MTVKNVGQSSVTKLRLNLTETGISNIVIISVDVLSLDPQSSPYFSVKVPTSLETAQGDYTVRL